MRLKFQTNSGIRFELDISSNDTLQEVKRKIHSIYEIPISSQTLCFKTNKIETDDDLLAAACTVGSQIYLSIATEPPPRWVPVPPSTSSRRLDASESQIAERSEAAVGFQLPQPSLPMTVVLKYGGATKPVEGFNAEDKASLMRTILDIVNPPLFPDLPNPYFLMRNQKPIDENRSLSSQIIADGDVIGIFPGCVAMSMSLTLETNRPNQKAFIHVETHSDDTILQLKEIIGTNEGIPVDKILIMKNEIEQPNHNTLQACSITSEVGIKVEIPDRTSVREGVIVLDDSS